MTSIGAPNPEALLQAGTIVVVHSAHPDAEDDYELRLLADGARALDCVLPGLPSDAFRAVFSNEALATGDALLAVAQTSSTGRHGDREYGGDAQPRTYTYRATTPPFLLSESLGARVRGREPIQLHFYDFLDEGRAIDLTFWTALIATATRFATLLPSSFAKLRVDAGHTAISVEREASSLCFAARGTFSNPAGVA